MTPICFRYKNKNMSDNKQYQFSEKLRIKAKKVLEEKAGHSLSMDSVDLCLDRLSQLGILFAKNVQEGRTKIDGYIPD